MQNDTMKVVEKNMEKYMPNHRNPPTQVQINITHTQDEAWRQLIDWLVVADIVVPTFVKEGVCRITLRCPKHVVNNSYWAEKVVRYLQSRGVPAIAVRS
jgi:hypothetical protein